MSTAEKLGMGLVVIGLATALTLPGRQTPAVIGRFFSGARGLLGTAITGKAP